VWWTIWLFDMASAGETDSTLAAATRTIFIDIGTSFERERNQTRPLNGKRACRRLGSPMPLLQRR
jgi:hypothetical protein